MNILFYEHLNIHCYLLSIFNYICISIHLPIYLYAFELVAVAEYGEGTVHLVLVPQQLQVAHIPEIINGSRSPIYLKLSKWLKVSHTPIIIKVVYIPRIIKVSWFV